VNLKKYVVHLKKEERRQLEKMCSTGTHKSREIRRATILLSSDKGLVDEMIAQKIDAHYEAEIVSLVCSIPPEGYKRWMIELLKIEISVTKGLKSQVRQFLV